ncbi:MAG TPA: hypothetical protein VHI13_04125 [Candidatus Kapabacteria bacterium]|nr:hypothetical protein [Candidatus Kapabacteria bacterium]
MAQSRENGADVRGDARRFQFAAAGALLGLLRQPPAVNGAHHAPCYRMLDLVAGQAAPCNAVGGGTLCCILLPAERERNGMMREKRGQALGPITLVPCHRNRFLLPVTGQPDARIHQAMAGCIHKLFEEPGSPVRVILADGRMAVE